jgi:hypothetical protein
MRALETPSTGPGLHIAPAPQKQYLSERRSKLLVRGYDSSFGKSKSPAQLTG